MSDYYATLKVRRCLSLGPIVRTPRGWRFGTRRVSERMVARLIADGHAVRNGDRCEKASEVRS